LPQKEVIEIIEVVVSTRGEWERFRADRRRDDVGRSHELPDAARPGLKRRAPGPPESSSQV
jgi:hypothetical protein